MIESQIRQFDVLVHPDFHLSWTPRPILTTQHNLRRLGWDARTSSLAFDPQVVMFYFSTFVRLEPDTNKPYVDRGVNEVYRDDQERIKKYKDQLGERFFLFAGSQRLSGWGLERILTARGFSYDPDAANLYAYGEYLDACVDSWGNYLTKALKLQESNSHKIEDLSLRSGDELRLMLGKLI